MSDIGRVDIRENNEGKWEVYTRVVGILATFDTEKEATKDMVARIQEKLTPGATKQMRQAFSFGEGQKATQVHSGWTRSGG